MKRKAKPERPSLTEAKRLLAQTLERSGYTTLKKAGAKSLRPPMPERFNGTTQVSTEL